MIRWAYKILSYNHSSDESCSSWLNKLGEQGWENYFVFAPATVDGVTTTTFLFKRPSGPVDGAR